MLCVLFFFLFFTSFSLSPPPLHLQWNGVDASPFERTAGIEVAAGLSDRQSATVVPAITGDLLAPGETHTNAQTLDFWSLIEGSPDTVQASVDDDDVASGVKSFSMYRLSDANTDGDVVEHTPVQTNVAKLDIDLLDPDDAYVIDAFKVCYIRAAAMSRSRANLLNPHPPLSLLQTVYVWIGEGATDQEREGSVVYAEQYVDSSPAQHISKFTPVRRVLQGAKWPKELRKAFGVSTADVDEKHATPSEAAAATVSVAGFAASAVV